MMFFSKKMRARKKQRLVFLLFSVVVFSLSIFLALTALRDNVVFFFSPSEVLAGETTKGEFFRLGGLVVGGSIERSSESGIIFTLSDGASEIQVSYQGILPNLFSEGQGAIAKGFLGEDGMFHAHEILAKHDENYAPPELQKILDRIDP